MAALGRGGKKGKIVKNCIKLHKIRVLVRLHVSDHFENLTNEFPGLEPLYNTCGTFYG